MTDAYEDQGPGLTSLQDLMMEFGAMKRRVEPKRDDQKDFERAKDLRSSAIERNKNLSLEEIKNKLDGDKPENSDDDNEHEEDAKQKRLNELDEELDLDDHEFLEQLGRQRLAELKAEESAKKAAESALNSANQSQKLVRLLVPQEFQSEVMDACLDKFIVMAIVRSDGHEPSNRFLQCFTHLAMKFPEVKFVRMEATSSIENFPLSHAPALLAYSNGKPMQQWSFANNLISTEIIEWELKQMKIVKSELEEDPRENERNKQRVTRKAKQNRNKSIRNGKREDDDDEDEDDDD